jgi:hypothetical protein
MEKRVVKEDIFNSLSEEEHRGCILSTHDHVQRSAALNDNGDLVDLYFHHWLHKLLDIIGAAMKIEDYIICYEAQARGTIHAHLLLQIKGGPSNRDLENAKLAEKSNVPESKRAEIAAAKERAIKFACSQMGVSGVHPNPDPVNWPCPYGQDVHTPAPENNILRQDYTTLEQDESLKDRYERLVNRTMLHNCKPGYCLKKTREKELACCCDFPKALVGFKETYEAPMDGSRSYLIRPGRAAGIATQGAEYNESEKLIFQRNHPTLVHHIAELLTIWGANIEGRPVESYEQVIRYLLKYMMKDETNSQTFSTICKAVVESAEEDEPV